MEESIQASVEIRQAYSNRKGCPCCSFDLFLPPNYTPEAGKGSDSICNSEGDNEDYDTVSPKVALKSILRSYLSGDSNPLILVDTHGHPQLERDQDETYLLDEEKGRFPQLKAVVCAVEPADWKTTEEYASKSSSYLPAFGIHPWYLGDGLPGDWLSQLEELLLKHPSAIVGEIGLCKMARWTRQYSGGKTAAMEIQRQVFLKQLELAARLRRPVSVHCVNQHGVFVQVLKDILQQNDGQSIRNRFPPAIAMHSFTGTAHHAKELLTLEKQIQAEGQLNEPLFYFGFSHTVNFVMNTSEKSRRKGREAVASIPFDRIMVESDVHSTEDLMGGTLGAVAYVAWARDESVSKVAFHTSTNALSFISTVSV